MAKALAAGEDGGGSPGARTVPAAAWVGKIQMKKTSWQTVGKQGSFEAVG